MTAINTANATLPAWPSMTACSPAETAARTAADAARDQSGGHLVIVVHNYDR